MAGIDYEKTPANENIAFWLGPTASGVLGITDITAPLADELNNTGSTSGMQPAHQSVSWNDFGFGIQSSETLNEPSLSDASTYEEFGQSNFGGNVSQWMPLAYDDNSNMHSIIYDLTEAPGSLLDAAMRIDGETKASVAAADGDFVSAFRVEVDSETNPFTPGESKRRTFNLLQKSEFGHFVVVGAHTITLVDGPTLALTTAAGPVRSRAAQQGRDVTNYLTVTTSNAAVAQVYPGGFIDPLSAGSATVTYTDPGTGDSAALTVNVT